MIKLGSGKNILITVPSHNWLRSDVDDFGGHFKRYNKLDFKSLCENSDTELEYFSYFFGYLVTPTYLLRSIPYKLGKRRSPENILQAEQSQHAPKGITKWAFDSFEKRELRRLKKMRSKSFGASCIVLIKTK